MRVCWYKITGIDVNDTNDTIKNIKFKYGKNWFKKRLKVTPYTTKEEKQILLLDDDATYEDILSVVSDIEPLNELEAVALLFKYRESSVSDLIEVTKECPHCNFINPCNIEISEFFDMDYQSALDIPQGIFFEVEDIINTKIADNLVIKDYNKIRDAIIEQSKNIFNPLVKRECKKCLKTFELSVNPRSIMSKSTASNIFREYIDISYYTANGKLDIDSMYPYEREIYLNIIKDRLKKESEIKEGI